MSFSTMTEHGLDRVWIYLLSVQISPRRAPEFYLRLDAHFQAGLGWAPHTLSPLRNSALDSPTRALGARFLTSPLGRCGVLRRRSTRLNKCWVFAGGGDAQ